MASPAVRRYGSACSAWPTSLPDWTTPGKSRRCEMCAIGCDQAQKPMDQGFIALLFLVSASGFALWLCRGTHALPMVLCLHLAAVMALFATLPYGKFAHGIFRSAALLRYCVERRQPGRLDHRG